MKRLIWVVLFLATGTATSFWLAKRNHATPPLGTAESETLPATATETPPLDSAAVPRASNFGTASRPAPAKRTAPRLTPDSVTATDALPDPVAKLRQGVDLLVSPQTSFDDKYHTWVKLRDEGKMDQVIGELQARATNNPTAAEIPAALGQAYLHKIAVTKDTRDYAVLGSQADRSFDTALDLDPANWEARFFKATAMSYWPAEMNRRPEVIERFTKLIQDQETQTSQPQFAQSYYWLGETYQKTGRADYADQVWRRGAALFPNDPTLKQKLASQ